jgi:hypothetical protein
MYPARQLTRMFAGLTGPLCVSPERVPLVVSLFAGSLIASLAVSFFFVARRFTRSDSWAAFAVFLLLFSAPFLTAAWIVCAGLQSMVPLLICLGLLSYWRAVEAKRFKWVCYVCLFLIMFFGHWFREFVGLLPLLVIFLEIQRARRPTWLMAVCLLCFLHALFPSALTRLFYPSLPLLPVYRLDIPLGSVMSGGGSFLSELKSLLAPFRLWYVSANFLFLLPPCLWIMVFFALALKIVFRKSGASAGERCPPGQWLCLTVWFLLFFLPFYKVYREQVHLAYSLVPMSVIIAVLMRDLLSDLRRFQIRSPRWFFAVILCVVIGDHALNLPGVRNVVSGVNDGTMRMAAWFKSNVRPGSVVVGNAGGQTVDILYYSGDYFNAYWVQPIPFPRPDSGKTSSVGGMSEMIADERGKRDIYFLDMTCCFFPGKEYYHGHKYVRGLNFRTKKLGRIHCTRVYYPFLDPLKHFVPRLYISFLGAPDSENEFYTGPAQDGSLFLRETHVDYDVYRVLGARAGTKITASSSLQPELGPGCLLENRDPTWHAAAPVVFPQTLTFEFPSDRTVRSVSFHPQGEPSWPEPHNSAMVGRSPKRVGVETSSDGADWRELCVIDPACSALRWNSHTLPAPVTTKFIRLKIYSSCREGLTLKGVKFED